jgi:CheY-like chemotaxis protein/HPt (histidine-containing phosphotransfer) domain-containing protein
LQLKGHSVVVANNGREALAALDRQTFDAVFMDIHMPGMDGLEATKAIRQKEHGTQNRLPIIAMTANAMVGDRERYLEAGMDGYISKPIDPSRLFDALERYVLAKRQEFNAKPPGPSSGQDAVAGGGARWWAAPKSEYLDLEAACIRAGGDASQVRLLAQTLLDECGRLMNDIRHGIASNDARLVQRSAHTLRGSADVFESAPVVEIAAKLEAMGREATLEGANAALADLEVHVNQLESELTAVLNSDVASVAR